MLLTFFGLIWCIKATFTFLITLRDRLPLHLLPWACVLCGPFLAFLGGSLIVAFRDLPYLLLAPIMHYKHPDSLPWQEAGLQNLLQEYWGRKVSLGFGLWWSFSEVRLGRRMQVSSSHGPTLCAVTRQRTELISDHNIVFGFATCASRGKRAVHECECSALHSGIFYLVSWMRMLWQG